MGDVEGKDIQSQRRMIWWGRGAHRGTHNKNVSLKPLAWKKRGAKFGEFLQPDGLKA